MVIIEKFHKKKTKKKKKQELAHSDTKSFSKVTKLNPAQNKTISMQ